MRANPILVSALAAGLLAGSASVAVSQGTATTPGATATPGATTTEVENDNDDGFDFGWLGLLGLLGLTGLKKRKNDHVVVRDNVGRPHV